MTRHGNVHLAIALVASLVGTAPISAQARDQATVARNLVAAVLIKPGDKVLISGGVRDAALMEDIAVETMKAGGQPMIALQSESLVKRSYTEVPAWYDTMPPSLDIAMINTFDAQITVDVGETEGLLASVPVSRRQARTKAGEPARELQFKKVVRLVNLGNGLYPTATTATRLGIPQTRLAEVFWRAAAVPAATLRARAEALRQTLAAGKSITVTHSNGTNLTFAADLARAIISDGALTPEKLQQGSAAALTWLPAGELILPAVSGSASGTLVIDREVFDGKLVEGLTLRFANGKLTSMMAKSNVEAIKAFYDAASGAKDEFGFIDIGVNPETTVPVGTGRIVWGAPGSIVFGIGDNRIFGGTNASSFALSPQLGGATMTVDGRPVIVNGTIR